MSLTDNRGNGILEQLIKYCFTGGIAFVVDFSILYLLTDIIGLHYLIGATCGFCAGLVITYLGSIFWIFSEHRIENSKSEFAIFASIGVVGLMLTNLFMWILSDPEILGVNHLIAKIITTVIVTLWNFLAKKYILFTKSK